MAERLVARTSPVKVGAILAFCLALLVVALWGPSLGLNRRPVGDWVRWPVGIFFGILCLSWLRSLFDDRPQIAIDRGGVLMQRWSDQAIPWSAIRACRVARQTTRWPFYQRWICLDLHDPAAHPRTTRAGRFLGRDWNLGYGDITMMMVGLDQPVEDAWETIERFAPADVELDGSQLGGERRRAPP